MHEYLRIGAALRKFDEALKTQSAINPEKRKARVSAIALAKIQARYRIERFYNPKPRHSTLGYVSPIDYEKQTKLA